MTQQEPNNISQGDLIEASNTAGFFQLLDAHIEETDLGRGKVSIRVDERLMHPQMIVHGGVIFTLADTAMSMALLSMLPADTHISTIEAKINYLLPVRTGELVAEANSVQQGRSIAVLEATVYNIQEETRQAVARILGTFSVGRLKQAI
ncbi:MAG: PaaI family thioesterase [Ktedonobacteraceae bacterium]